MGIGVDIVSVKKIETIIKRWGETFLKRVYSSDELSLGNKLRFPYQFYAGRFAAKEAVFKALDKETKNLRFYQIEILKEADGSPFVNNCKEYIGDKKISLSISHNDEFAVSVCLIN